MKQNATTGLLTVKMWVCSFLASSVLCGCVLPGGDRPVGAVHIEGQAVRGANVVPGEVFVIRRYGTAQQQFDALFNIGNPACNPVRRYSAPIQPDGSFSIDLPSFLSGDPIWIIPPLFTLVPFGERAEKQGLVFLLRVTQPKDCIYRIDARKQTPLLHICETNRWNFRALTEAEQKHVQVTATTIQTNLSASFSMSIRQVRIEITDWK